MAQAFTEEPIAIMCEMNTIEQCKMAFEFQLKYLGCAVVDNGLSVVAIDKETGKICGGFTSMDNDLGAIPLSVWFKMIPFIYKMNKKSPRNMEFETIIDQLN